MTYEKWRGIAPATAARSLNTKGLMGILITSLFGLFGTVWFVTYQYVIDHVEAVKTQRRRHTAQHEMANEIGRKG